MKENSDDGSLYYVGGFLALMVGLKVAGIICGPLAIYLGSQAVKHDEPTIGKIVIVGGWIETVLSILGIAAMMVS